MMHAPPTLTGKDLVFYPDPHEYFTPPGRDGGARIPSVTQILRAVGVSEDFDAIERARPGVVTFARDLGTAIHADIHAFNDNDLDGETVDPRVKPYIDAWALWRENFRAVPLVLDDDEQTCEFRVYHPLGFCGTLDGIFLIGHKHVLVDAKSGSAAAAGCHLQTSAYEAAFHAEHPLVSIDERWAVELCPDRVVPYRVVNYTKRPDSWRDWPKFQACLTVYWEQAVRRCRASY